MTKTTTETMSDAPTIAAYWAENIGHQQATARDERARADAQAQQAEAHRVAVVTAGADDYVDLLQAAIDRAAESYRAAGGPAALRAFRQDGYGPPTAFVTLQPDRDSFVAVSVVDAALRVRSLVNDAGGTVWYALVLDAEGAIVAERGGETFTVEQLTAGLLAPWLVRLVR